MAFLKKVSQETKFADWIRTLKPNTKAGIENTVNLFARFCKTQDSTLDERK